MDSLLGLALVVAQAQEAFLHPAALQVGQRRRRCWYQ
jgi:hypothetical protein